MSPGPCPWLFPRGCVSSIQGHLTGAQNPLKLQVPPVQPHAEHPAGPGPEQRLRPPCCLPRIRPACSQPYPRGGACTHLHGAPRVGRVATAPGPCLLCALSLPSRAMLPRPVLCPGSGLVLGVPGVRHALCLSPRQGAGSASTQSVFASVWGPLTHVDAVLSSGQFESPVWGECPGSLLPSKERRARLLGFLERGPGTLPGEATLP